MRFARDFLLSLGGASVPKRFLVTPPDLRPAKAELARGYYNGQFSFVGQTVQVGSGSPFGAVAPSPEWASELCSFAWLRHMAAASGQLPGAQSKSLVADWLSNHSNRSMGRSQDAGLIARRLIAFLQYGRFLLTGADLGFYRLYMRGIASHVSALQRHGARSGDPLTRARVQVALGLATVCLPVSDALAERTQAHLQSVLDDVILADGGFVTRNPDHLADLVANLLSLAKSCIALNRPVPASVVHTLDRALPRLRSFAHRDGELATFAGADGGSSSLVAVLLANDETAAKPTVYAPQSGYISLQQGASSLIVDVGPKDCKQSGEGYQSLSALEFSHDGERVCVNVGTPPAHLVKYIDIARGAPAHNRLSVDTGETESVDLGSVKLTPWLDLSDGEDGYILTYRVLLDGQAVTMVRGVRLSNKGRILDGFDRVAEDASAQTAIHFHVPVKTVAARTADGSVIINSRTGQRWRVTSDVGRVDVQPSLQLAHPAGVQNTVCVQISFDPSADRTVAWRWARES
ncbi:MAG: heparinase II/III family protein [Pseudomonadota bacterium]